MRANETDPTVAAPFPKAGVIAIGRNEGKRLQACIQSLAGTCALIVYVDSGSTDGSIDWARNAGVAVVALDMKKPFTAARARNEGFSRLQQLAPQLPYVQFVDGDCQIDPSWINAAVAFLDDHPEVAAVCGRRRERYPDRSIYNKLCDIEWDTPIGRTSGCGGDSMIRADAFERVHGYRADLIAGEEPELCLRLRTAGWKIWRLDQEMTVHDADMLRFGQWWRRNIRSGYAFAQGAHLHGALPERYYVWESRRALIWGLGLPMVCLAACALFGGWGLTVLLIYPLQILRRTAATTGDLLWRAQRACFELLSKFPEALGQLKFARDRWLLRQGHLIEYK